MTKKKKAAESAKTTETKALVANLVSALAKSISERSQNEKLPHIIINDNRFHVYDFEGNHQGWGLLEVENSMSSDISEELLVMRSPDNYEEPVVLATDAMDWALKLLQNPIEIEAYLRSHEANKHLYFVLSQAKNMAMILIENYANYLSEVYGLEATFDNN